MLVYMELKQLFYVNRCFSNYQQTVTPQEVSFTTEKTDKKSSHDETILLTEL